MTRTQQTAAGLLTLALALGCAKERPIKFAAEDSLRVKKSELAGVKSYNRVITDSKYTAKSKAFLPTGLHVSGDSLVQFVIKKDVVEVTAIDPLYNSAATAKLNAVLLSFPVKHVDVLRKQNPDGTDTHEEEVTESRRAWDQREYIVIDTTKNLNEDPELGKVTSATALTGLHLDREAGYLDFKVEKTLETGAVIQERFAFLNFKPSATYQQRLYPRDLQQRFGFFKTRTYKFDQYGRALQSLLVETMNRWDTSKAVVYYLSPGFPEHLKPVAQSVFQKWNEAFKTATGHDVLELRENTGQELGDLRYSFINYVDGNESNGLLGYGPSVANPRTGEIIKADVNLYGGSLKNSIFRERVWNVISTLSNKAPRPKGQPAATMLGRIQDFLTDATSMGLANAGAQLLAPEKMNQILAPAKTPEGNLDANVLLKQARASQVGHGREFTTRLSDSTLGLVNTLAAENLSDETIEERIFGPLLAHELGHTLGLRHNFMGSADYDHFEGEAKSASVMDYGFLSLEEPMGPGPYDVAAIQLGYGSGDAAAFQEQLAKNFLFCTDENVFDARNAQCLQFDSGSSLTEIAKNQVTHYFVSHLFNNLRNDRLVFPGMNEYLTKVIMTLLPIRVVYDNANAIVTRGQAYLEGSTAKPSDTNDRYLWSMLKNRIEADANSKYTHSLDVSATRTVLLDQDKLRAAVKDAVSARGMAFSGLATVLMDNNPRRPDHDGADLEFEELAVRGVLPDKVYALLFLLMPTSDPASGSGAVSVFDQYHRPMSKILSDLISNTSIGPNGLELGSTDINLRYAALDLIKSVSRVQTISSGELLQLVQLQPVEGKPLVTAENEAKAASLVKELEKLRLDLNQAQLVLQGVLNTPPSPLGEVDTEVVAENQTETVEEARKKVEDLEKQVIDKHLELSQAQLRLSVGTQDEDAEALLANSLLHAQIVELMLQMQITGPTDDGQKKLSELFTEIIKTNIAQVTVTDGRVLKTPIQFSTFGNLETASGRLLTFNINLIEDRASVMQGLVTILNMAIEGSKDDKEKAELGAMKAQLVDQSLLLQRYLASERRFAERLYTLYR
ncbi:MAG: zinc-dependent metalloprotease [Deltaproteobacteria bacterium]|nr:zinc-dependent metalloprotease [Deltaproteobacteria bacterium]